MALAKKNGGFSFTMEGGEGEEGGIGRPLSLNILNRGTLSNRRKVKGELHAAMFFLGGGGGGVKKEREGRHSDFPFISVLSYGISGGRERRRGRDRWPSSLGKGKEEMGT